MKSTLTAILFFLVYNLTFAQYAPRGPHEKAKFESLNPIYYEEFYDADFRSQGSDGYNCFSHIATTAPLLHGNLYYSILYNTIDSPGFLGNYYLSCTDFDTGKLVWQQKVFFKDVPNIEIPRLMKVNDQGELVVLGHKNASTYTGSNYLDDLILFDRRYDAQTGDFISLSHLDYDDPEAYRATYHYFYDDFLFLEEGDNYRIVELIDVAGRVGFRSALMDNLGRKIGKADTLLYQYYDEAVYSVNIKTFGNDTLVLSEVGMDSLDRAFIAVRYLTRDLKVLGETILLSPVRDNLDRHRLIAVSPDKSKLLMVAPLVLLNGGLFDNATYLIVNLKTNTIKSISTNFGGSTYLDWYSDDSSMIVARVKTNVTNNADPQPNTIQFAKLSDGFQIEVIREHKLQGLTKGLGYFYAYNYKDKEVLQMFDITFYKASDRNTYSQDIFALANSIIAFKKGDFLPLGPSATTEITEKDEVTIYPNPGTDGMYIHTSSPWSSIVIRSAMGQQVLEHKTTDYLDVSSLSAGMYLVDIRFSNGQQQTLRYIKM